MASVAKLKDKARDFERKEDWGKAVEAYLQVIQATEKGDGEAELSLYNRVGDLYLRLGKPSNAVDYYSKAADHYGEAGLYNNAIALCNKALRYQPDRLELYRKLGKLSAEQGFVTDARRWYLEYAEKLAKQGRKDAAFDALKEFASLAEDPEIREMLAAQLNARGETADAVVQMRLAWTQYSQQSNRGKADEIRQRILSLDPTLEGTDLTLTADGAAGSRGADLPGMYMDSGVAAAPPAPAETIGVDEGFGFGESAPPEPAAADALPGLDNAPTPADVETTTLAGLESTDFGSIAAEVTATDLPTLDVESTSLVEDEAPTAFDLPTLDDETEDAEAAEPLPVLGDVDEDDATEEAAGAFDLPMLDDGRASDEEADAGELPTFDMGADALPTLDDEEAEADELPTFDAELPTFGEAEEESDALSPLEAISLDTAEEPGTADAADIDEWGDTPGTHEDLAELTESGSGLIEEEEIELEPEAELEAEAEPELEPDIEPEPEPEPEPDIEPEPEPEPAAAGARVATADVHELIAAARTRYETGERREALASLEAQHVNLADAGRLADAYRVTEALVAMDPDTVSSHQARVEYAFRLDDRGRLVAAYLDFAACLRRTGATSKADSVYGRVLEIDPQNEAARRALAKPEPVKKSAAPTNEFVDLGGLLMEDEEQTTRFVVAETVESGDEEKDFAEMLSTFREKIAQHVPQEDTESHYDLGIAFKEMGLVDEAISEFQIALRGGNERLKIYEELGSCFMQKAQYNIAAKLLARGAQLPARDDAELLGVYYLLGRCYEEMGQTAEAKEAYERVLGLDIDFRDVNDRLARL